MQIRRELLPLLLAPALAVAVPTAAHAAVGLTKAELNGTQLRVEGSGALPQHTITVNPGGVTGTSDANGSFKIQYTPYNSTTCQVSVSDGSTTATATLAGCTPTSTSTGSTSTTGPAVTLQPAALTFPSELTGQTSPAQNVSVTNTGGASLFVNGLSHSGTAALDFTVTQDGCSGVTLAPSASCGLAITFTPSADGTRTAAIGVIDNAPSSPQQISLTGNGAGTGTGATPLGINTATMTCTSTGCDVGGGPRIVNNFFGGLLSAQGGTAPYTWSATSLPPGLTFTAAGLLSGTMSATGTFSFPVTVHDSAGASSTTLFSLTVTTSPAPGPSSCQRGSTVKEALSGAAIAGRTPTGEAVEDESNLTACGGFGLLSAKVSSVSLPDGTVLWVYLDHMAVGTIKLSGGAGSMPTYNVGDFGASFDQVTVSNGPPSANGSPLVLSGGSFH